MEPSRPAFRPLKLRISCPPFKDDDRATVRRRDTLQSGVSATTAAAARTIAPSGHVSGLESEPDRAPVIASGRGARGARALTFSRVGGRLSGYLDQSCSGWLLDEAGGGRSSAESALAGAASKAAQASKMRWTG